MAGIDSALTMLSALGSGLAAGLFFAFSNFVMAALGRLPPEQGIAAMQAINVTVLNRWFFAVFFGTGAASAAAALGAWFLWGGEALLPLAGGAALYILGSIGITMVCNVPLNRALATVDPRSPEGAALWQRYLVEWTFWNHFRTAACVAATALFIVAWGLGPG